MDESAGVEEPEGERIFLGLGSNLGDRCRNLAQAVRMLSRLDGIALCRQSSLYESAPVGPDQPRFLNAAVEVRSRLPAAALLAACKNIEEQLGRVDGERWGPRLIDIDLLLGEEIIAEPLLQVPHLELHKRAFALLPLAELAPDATHPILNALVSELLVEVADQDVFRVGEFYVEA